MPDDGELQSPTILFQSPRRALISQAELDALFSALHTVASTRGRPGQPLAVSLFDFRHTAHLSRDHTRLLADVCRSLCRVLGRTISVYLNTEADFQVLSIAGASFEQLVRSFAPTPVVAVFRFSAHSPLAFWELSPPLAFAVVEYMLGAEEPSPPPNREITPIEAALLRRFYDELLSTWTLTWRQLEGWNLRTQYVTASLARVDTRQVEQNMVQVVFQARVGKVNGSMNLGLPVSPLHILLRPTGPTIKPAVQTTAPWTAGAASKIKLEVAVQLPSVRLPLAMLRSLRPGTVLPLGLRTDVPLVVRVNHRPKFEAEGGLMDNHYAARLTNPLD
jgi:flagellar motor switch protein FliM